MSDADGKHLEDQPTNGGNYAVGFCRPPVHSRFKPGQSGNPSGRVKGSQNFKTLFQKILKEEVSLQDGAQSRKISKAEAIMRRLIVGALKGDSRDLHALFRLGEQTGQFEEPASELRTITRVIVDWKAPGTEDDLLAEEFRAGSQLSRD